MLCFFYPCIINIESNDESGRMKPYIIQLCIYLYYNEITFFFI